MSVAPPAPVSTSTVRAASSAEPGALGEFHPAVRQWFLERFPHGPTDAQAVGWPAIRRGEHTLIAAPTGSGKTLAAFLAHIDRLYRRAEHETLPDGIDVIYVSPLKALVADIYENLERPLQEIAAVAKRMGRRAPEIRVGMRTGDTPSSQRAALLKRAPHILVTTPESLFLLVTAQRSRLLMTQVHAVIVDEIHALARDKRGVHLALTLERLAALPERRPVRIGLSATQKPLTRIAELLVGCREAQRCHLVDQGHRRALQLMLELPDRELGAVAPTEQLEEVVARIARHVRHHRTTLIFTNTRRLSERLAHLLKDELGDDRVAAHHGSLSKERRLRVERQLRAGQLQALVATASLELGIDVGPVELVCQIGSPRSIATFLQRVGRSGHTRFGTPKGILYPMTRDELVECAALLRAVHGGRLDSSQLPEAPLDILAQQLVAECAAQDWDEDALFELVRRAAPYAALRRKSFDEVLQLMSAGIETGRGKRAAYLHRDRVHGKVRGRRGARLAALTSSGAIPETADYRVVLEPDETFIGTVNEDFAVESMAGDVFLLGSSSWRIRRIERGVVRVVDAAGAHPTVPFWLGEAPARSAELSSEVSTLRAVVQHHLEHQDQQSAVEQVRVQCGIDRDAASALVDYLCAARAALGVLPTQQRLVVERFFDDTGGMQLVVHSPWGARINRGLGLLLRKRFCRSFDFELQAAASDDAVVLSLGPQHSFPLSELSDFLSLHGVRDALVHALLPTPMFQTRWRWNLNRALVVLRRKGGKRNPPALQRMEADDITAAVFPSLAACQDNAVGPREIPEHPLVQQTLQDCLTEAMDLDGLERLLRGLAGGAVVVHAREMTEPSVLAHEILNGRPYTFLDDAPLEERRTRAVQLRRGLPLEQRDLAQLDVEAIERVREEAAPRVTSAEELHDLLCERVAGAPREDWREHFAALAGAGRAFEVTLSGRSWWVPTERLTALSALFGELRVSPAPTDGAGPNAPRRGDAPRLRDAATDPDVTQRHLVQGQLEASGPTTTTWLAEQLPLSPAQVAAALAALEQQGYLLRGHFDSRLDAAQVCARRLLSRIHAYTQARLRRDIEPVSSQDFMRFLLRYHGLTPQSQRRGPDALQPAIEQLQGFEAAAGQWESELLAARVLQFDARQLDMLCWSGQVVWGRLSLRSATNEQSSANFSRTTPITLALREDFPWLLQAVRGQQMPQPSASPGVRRITEALRSHGALFAAELAAQAELGAEELVEALWDNVARGLITSDGFAALRALLADRRAATGRPRRARRWRPAVPTSQPHQGRWALLDSPREPWPDDELAEALAEQLLARYGVVFRDLLVRESFTIPWRELLWALRRLEARGLIRGGRFVHGFAGEQYALPEVVEALRRIRREQPCGERVTISACDPLNLVGIVVPGPKVAAVPGNQVTYVDGNVEQTNQRLGGQANGSDDTQRSARL